MVQIAAVARQLQAKMRYMAYISFPGSFTTAGETAVFDVDNKPVPPKRKINNLAKRFVAI